MTARPKPKSRLLLAGFALSIFVSGGFNAAWCGNYRHSEIESAIEGLKSSDPDTKRHAAMKLADMGPEAKESVPQLIIALSDPDPGIKDEVATALGKMGPDAKAAVPALIVFLKDKKISLVRGKAATALGNIGPNAAPAVPALAEALSDQEVWTGRAAAMALGDLGPVARSAAPDLIKALSTSDPDLRCMAGRALQEVGLSTNDVDAAIPCLSDEPDCVRSCAARALGALGPEAAKAIPALTKLTDDSSQYVRVDAILALQKIDSKHKLRISKTDREIADDYGQSTPASWGLQWNK